MRSAVNQARDDLVMEIRTYRMQIPSTCRNPIHDNLVNRQDDG